MTRRALRFSRMTHLRLGGPLGHLEKVLANETLTGTMGIGHTRWATHGKPSERNAHPQRSGEFAIVHNGIIENYLALKQQLQAEGFAFDSDTDTEVAAHLLASDVTPLLSHMQRVLYLEDGEIGVLTPSRITAIGANGVDINRQSVTVAWDAAAVEKGDYPHFMAKEIHEQPTVINETLRGRYSFDTGDVELPTLTAMAESLAKVRQMWIVACGLSIVNVVGSSLARLSEAFTIPSRWKAP